MYDLYICEYGCNDFSSENLIFFVYMPSLIIIGEKMRAILDK